MGLLEPGNITNLYNRPALKNADGSYSTTKSKSWNIEGKETLLPTVVNGKQLSDKEAIQRYKDTGEHLGKFATPEAADYYAQKLHESQAAVVGYYGKTSTTPTTSATPSSFKKGGKVKKSGMAMVHRGERVLTKHQTDLYDLNRKFQRKHGS